MASGAAGDGAFQGVYGGCISTDEIGVRRRPYHSNCYCALHNSDGAHSTHFCHVAKLSYPIRRSWSEGSLAAIKSTASPGSSPCCRSSSTVAAPVAGEFVDLCSK